MIFFLNFKFIKQYMYYLIYIIGGIKIYTIIKKRIFYLILWDSKVFLFKYTFYTFIILIIHFSLTTHGVLLFRRAVPVYINVQSNPIVYIS